MGIVAYTRQDHAPESAVLFPVGYSPDIHLAESSSGNFRNQKFTDPEGNEVHWLLYVPPTGDWSVSAIYERPLYSASEVLYFLNGIHMSATYSGTGYIWTLSNYFGMSYDAGANIFSGISNTVDATPGGEGYPPGHNTQVHGMSILDSTVILEDGTEYQCYYLVFGYEREGLSTYLIPGYGLLITKNFFEIMTTDPQGGIPQNPEGGDGPHVLHGEVLSFGTAEDRSTSMGGGGLAGGNAHGTHLYELDRTAYNDFINTIYGDQDDGFSFSDLWTQFKNSQHDPLSGLLGAFVIPYAPPSTAVSYIRISGQSIAVSGTCKAVTDRMGTTSETSIVIDKYHNSFLDYAPYTTVSLYLPFIGTVALNTNECMGGSVSVKYWIDFCTGDCVAYVTLSRRDDTDGIIYPTYYQYSGNCAGFIPVSANDAGISSIISGASSVFGGLLSAAAGNVGGLVTAAAGAIEIAEPKTNERHSGGFTGGSGFLGCLYPYVVINRPAEAIPPGYTKIIGGMSAQSGKVSEYKGFTQFMDVDLSQVPASGDELQEIRSALREGVYL